MKFKLLVLAATLAFTFNALASNSNKVECKVYARYLAEDTKVLDWVITKDVIQIMMPALLVKKFKATLLTLRISNFNFYNTR